MEKTIYQLLNEVETDFEEYEQTELSAQEKETYKQKILAEVGSMKMEDRKKNRRIWQKMAGLAAACAVVVGMAFLAANPVLAKQLISGVFGNLLATSNEGYIGEKELTEKVAMKATSVQKELSERQDRSNYAASAECNGVTIAISDAYCDGSSLYYTMVLWTDNEDLNKAETILPYLQDDDMLHMAILEGPNGELPMSSGGILPMLRKAEDGSYVCMGELDLYGMSEEDRENLQIEDGGIVNVRYEMNGITGVADIEQMDNKGRCKETARVEGEWNLLFPVTVDESSKEVIEVNKGENGIIVKNITRTDTTLVVEVNYSGYATRPPYNYNGFPLVSVKDSEGNWLDGLGGGYGGEELFTTMERVIYDGQKDLVISVSDYTDATGEKIEIAEIPVHLP